MNDSVQMYSEWHLTERYGKDPKISIFEGFFRKTRKMNDGVLSVLRVIFDAVSTKRPKISIFEEFFRKTRKMNDGVRMYSE